MPILCQSGTCLRNSIHRMRPGHRPCHCTDRLRWGRIRL